MIGENLLIYIVSFIIIWFGSGLIISSVDIISKKLKLSSFALSFFILGILTSIPEFAVGLTAVSEHNPEIFVGNLIGGVVVIFLLIIPVLAIFGNGIKLSHQMNDRNLLFSFLVILSPAFMIADRKVTNIEGVTLIILYMGLFYFIERKKGVLDNGNINELQSHSYSLINILKVLLGIGLVFVSSNIIVDKTRYFAQILSIPAFYISLVLLSLGTNLPEMSLAVRSVISGKKDIAFGDYLGSAAANTFLFGLFTILSSGEVLTADNFMVMFGFIAFALALFYHFSRSKRDISREEGIMLLLCYVLFIMVELWK